MLKRMKYEVDLKTTQAMLNKAVEVGAEFITIEGVLNDSHLIYNNGTTTGKRIKIGRQKPREYIILTHEFRNSQSNDLYMILTDDDKEAETFYKEWEEYMDEVEAEEV